MHWAYRTLRTEYFIYIGYFGAYPDFSQTRWTYKPRKHWLLQMPLSSPSYISNSPSFSPSDKEAWGFCILCCLICTEGKSCLFSSMQHLWFKILLTTFCCSWAAGYLSPLSEQTRKEQCRRFAGWGTCSSFHPTNKQRGGDGEERDRSSQNFLYQNWLTQEWSFLWGNLHKWGVKRALATLSVVRAPPCGGTSAFLCIHSCGYLSMLYTVIFHSLQFVYFLTVFSNTDWLFSLSFYLTPLIPLPPLLLILILPPTLFQLSFSWLHFSCNSLLLFLLS